MSPIELIPLAASMLAPVAERAFRGISDTMPFAGWLGSGPDQQETTPRQPDGTVGGEQLRPVRTEHLQSLAQHELSQLTQSIFAVFQRHDLDASHAFELSSGPSGRLAVNGDHPQRSDVEDALRRDPAIVEGYKRLAALTKAARRQQRGSEEEGRLRLQWQGSAAPEAGSRRPLSIQIP